ncbi:MAG: DUF5689 domain-containing protein [Bacteroidales bacterium]|nr:DUF5689 domain-containing protein [Bacteroidales bacterium]
MRNIKNISILIVAALLITTGCFKDPTEPQIDIDSAIPEGQRYTLANLIDSIAVVADLTYPYIFDHDASIYVTVTMDEKNGNLYKQVYVQDANYAIRLSFTETTGLSEGDSIRVYLKGRMFFDNNGTYEIKNLQPDSTIVVLANRRPVQPRETTLKELIDELKSNPKLANRLVKITDVQFSDFDLGETWADTTRTVSAVNHDLQDCDGNTIIVRTSSYAAFAGRTLPGGKGSMVAIASIYGTTLQLWNRSLAETKMSSLRCDGSSGNAKIILKETFATDQGDFSTYSVLGAQEWFHNAGYNCMAMSGLAAGATHENEDWLISPNLNFSSVTEARLSFSHTISKGGSNTVPQEYMKANQTIWISTDYTVGDPSNAHWTQFYYDGFPTGTGWVYVGASALIPTDFLGKTNVRIAFKYTCDNYDSATWQVNNLQISGEMR